MLVFLLGNACFFATWMRPLIVCFSDAPFAFERWVCHSFSGIPAFVSKEWTKANQQFKGFTDSLVLGGRSGRDPTQGDAVRGGLAPECPLLVRVSLAEVSSFKHRKNHGFYPHGPPRHLASDEALCFAPAT